MPDALFLWIGYVVAGLSAIAALAAAVIGVALLSNKAQHMLLASIGGWKIFLRYREWYHHNTTPLQALEEARRELQELERSNIDLETQLESAKRALMDKGSDDTHRCERCFNEYTPGFGESEACPACGAAGQLT